MAPPDHALPLPSAMPRWAASPWRSRSLLAPRCAPTCRALHTHTLSRSREKCPDKPGRPRPNRWLCQSVLCSGSMTEVPHLIWGPVFSSFGAMSLPSTASRKRYSRRRAAQPPAVTARSWAMESFMMTGRLRSSSLLAQRSIATRSTDMPASAASVACGSPTPRRRRVAATAAA